MKSGLRANCKGCAHKSDHAYNKQFTEKERALRQAMTLAYLNEHGSLPTCGCGCGATLTITVEGTFRRFLKHHSRHTDDAKRRIGEARRIRLEANRVPLTDVQRFLREYKAHHGLTWQEVAERGGISYGHLRHLGFIGADLEWKGVSKEWFQAFMERLAGVPQMPTTFQRKKIQAMKIKHSVNCGRIFGVMVTRNEEHRYLQACLDWHSPVLDGIFILDDQSDDATQDIALAYTDQVLIRPDDVPSFMEDEGGLRQFAWQAAAEILGYREGDWVIAIDADEFLCSSKPLREALDYERHRALLADFESVSFKMPEMWDLDGMHRTDGFWNRNNNIRLVKWQPGLGFPRKKMGGGSVPSIQQRSSTNAEELCLLHYGYADSHDRIDKYLRYQSLANHGHNPKHIESIMTVPKVRLWKGNLPPVWRGII